MLLHLTNLQISNIYSYLSSKNISQSVQNTFLKIFFKYGLSLVLLSDLELIQLTGLDKSTNRKHLSILEKLGLLLRHGDPKKIFGNKRKVQIILPEYLILPKNNDESSKCLTFTGTVAQKIETKYHDKKVVDVELSNVRSESGHIVFDKYWVKQEHISDPNSIKVNFKASLKVITDTRLILVPVRNQLHT